MTYIQPQKYLGTFYGSEPQAQSDPVKPYMDYLQTIDQYITEAKTELSRLAAGDPTRAQDEAYLQQALSYRQFDLQELQNLGANVGTDPLGSTSWDPLTGNMDDGTCGLGGAQQGTPFNRTDGKPGWDGPQAEIYSGSDLQDKEKQVSVRNVANFHASSNTEYWSVGFNGSQFVITVYGNATDAQATPPDPSKAKETFFMDDMTNLKASFDIDPNHIFFQGVLAGGSPAGTDSHSVNTADPHGAKLSVFGSDGKASAPAGQGQDALNPNYPKETGESVPHNVNGSDAYYDQDSKVSIHTYYDGSVKNNYITAQDSVDIYPATQADQVTAEYVPAGDSTGKIKLTYSYHDASGDKSETYIIDKATSIYPHVASLTGEAANDPKIKVGGVSSSDYPDWLKNLSKGNSTDKIISALKSAGYSYNSIADLVKDTAFPPSPPDSKIIKFLFELNGEDIGIESLLTTLYSDKHISTLNNDGKSSTSYFCMDNDDGTRSMVVFDDQTHEVSANTSWPKLSDILDNLPSDGDSVDQERVNLITAFDKAMKTNSWDEVIGSVAGFSKLASDKANNMVRQFLTALSASGDINSLVKAMPQNVKQAMIDAINAADKGGDKVTETNDGESYTDQEALSLLQAN